MNSSQRFNEVNLLADPLYGYISITKSISNEASEQQLLDTSWLQRLRRIHQLQSIWWVFPTAEHSRFVHLLGSMHLAGLFAQRIDESLRANFPDAPSPACVEETLRIAGLLHDVGHGPFGHFFDHEYLAIYNLDHEDIGRYLVLNQLGELINSLRASPSGRFATGESIDPRWIAWVMAPTDLPNYSPPNWLRACKPILCGPATVDNLDYVPRDAYMCGIAGVSVDVNRLMHYSFIHNGILVLHSHAMGALEMFLNARLHMYLQVYLHRTGRRFDLSMKEIFRPTISELLPGNPLDYLNEYLQLTDWSLLEAVSRWIQTPTNDQQRDLATKWEQLTKRNLPWKLAYESIVRIDTDLSSMAERIRMILSSSASKVQFEVDIASTSIAPNNPLADDGMVAIFDPIQRQIEHNSTRELMARLPQYNQILRIFTNNEKAIPDLSNAARKVLSS